MTYRFGIAERPLALASNKTMPPHNDAAERAILGAILTDESALLAVTDKGLRASDFFSTKHQLIFAAALSVAEHAIPDEVTVCAELHRLGELTAAGGMPYIHELTRHVEVTANAPAWAAIVIEAATRRKTIIAADTAKAAAHDPATPIAVSIEALQAIVTPESDSLPEAKGLTPFPDDALPISARRLVLEASASIQIPPAMPSLAALGVMSAALGKLGAINPLSDHIARANLYIVGVAEQGTGKGETFKYFLPPLLDIEKRATLRWEAEASAWRSELSQCEAKGRERAPAKKDAPTTYRFGESSPTDRIAELNTLLKSGPPVMIAEDMTAERMEAILEANKGELFVASSEAKRIFDNIAGRNNRDTGADDSDLWCKAWAGDPIRVQRMSRSVMVDDPRVSMLAFVQGDLAKEFTSKKAFFSRGLLARILFADTFARPSKIDPEKGRSRVSELAKADWGKLVTDCHAATHDGLGRKLAFSRSAAALFIRMHNEEVEKSLNGHMETNGVRARRVMQAERLAVVLHAMTHGARMFAHEISAQTAQDAARIEAYFRQFQERILDGHVSPADSLRRERILAALTASDKPMSLRALRSAAKTSSAEVVKSALVALIDAGQVKQVGKDYELV